VLGDIPNDSAAALLLIEHHWAVPLRDAVLRGGRLPHRRWVHQPHGPRGCRADGGRRGRSNFTPWRRPQRRPQADKTDDPAPARRKPCSDPAEVAPPNGPPHGPTRVAFGASAYFFPTASETFAPPGSFVPAAGRWLSTRPRFGAARVLALDRAERAVGPFLSRRLARRERPAFGRFGHDARLHHDGCRRRP